MPPKKYYATEISVPSTIYENTAPQKKIAYRKKNPIPVVESSEFEKDYPEKKDNNNERIYSKLDITKMIIPVIEDEINKAIIQRRNNRKPNSKHITKKYLREYYKPQMDRDIEEMFWHNPHPIYIYIYRAGGVTY